MSDSSDPFYRIGYALEAARSRVPGSPEGKAAVRAREKSPVRSGADLMDQLISVGTGALTAKMLDILPGRSKPGVLRLVRAAVAGAGAAAVLALVRSRLLDAPDEEPDAVSELLAGAGRGIVYGSVLEPHLPGPSLLRGATFAVIEYSVSPWGGLDGVLGAASPRRTIPVLGALMGTDALEAESLAEHMIFGATLGLLYGVAKDSSGTD